MEKIKYHFLLFELNKYKFAFDVSKINRIARSVEITPLPNAPDIVLGVINVQGKILPVIDIRKRFGFPEKQVEVDDFLIIGEVKNLSIAILIDDVNEIIDIPADHIIDKKNVLPGIPHIDGVLKLEGDIIYIHDLSKLLSLEEEEEIYTLLKHLDKEKESDHSPKKKSVKKIDSSKKSSSKKSSGKKSTKRSHKKKSDKKSTSKRTKKENTKKKSKKTSKGKK